MLGLLPFRLRPRVWLHAVIAVAAFGLATSPLACGSDDDPDATSMDGAEGAGHADGRAGSSTAGTAGSADGSTGGGAAMAGASDGGGAGEGGSASGQGGAGAGGSASAHAGTAGAAGTGGSAAGQGGTAAVKYPADRLDLRNWKLTLPIGSPGKPTEITQPALATFSMAPYFALDNAGDAVLFRANAGGVTTSGSSYPRSELREMTNEGADEASWSTTSGQHTMTLVEAITHLPVVKPQVVAAQIHDASDDVIEVRLEGQNLFVEHDDGKSAGVLDAAYVLGTKYTLRIVAGAGHIKVFYNDETAPKVDLAKSGSGCYFKAGAYTQSNVSKGDDAAAYGEVVIESLAVVHDAT